MQDGTDSCYDDEVELIQDVASSCTQIAPKIVVPTVAVQEEDDVEWNGVENLLSDEDDHANLEDKVDEEEKKEELSQSTTTMINTMQAEELPLLTSLDAASAKPANSQQLFLVRKSTKPTGQDGATRASREEYEELMERMVEMQLQQAQQLANVDEDGLETIDLTDDAGATSTGTSPGDKPQPAPVRSMMMMDEQEGANGLEQEDEGPAFLFRKTKSNNFFAVDDSQE